MKLIYYTAVTNNKLVQLRLHWENCGMTAMLQSHSPVHTSEELQAPQLLQPT